MERRAQKIGLDNPAFRGRLRLPIADRSTPAAVVNRSASTRAVRGATPKQHANIPAMEKPAAHHPAKKHIANYAIKSALSENSSVRRRFGRFSLRSRLTNLWHPKFALQTMAVLVFIIGLSVSLRAEHTNQQATATVEALSQQSDDNGDEGSSDMPSTKKPTQAAIHNYVVAPDLPRYISISKLGLKARVMQVGVKSNGVLDTPRNVYDAAWYTGSAKPGQQGATVIDGHVSSMRTKGVFYNLKNLQQGDTIRITKGDGTVLTYRIVQKQTYKAESVDMQKVIRPISEGKSGLNIITCTGKVKPGTNDFTHRIVVFAEQV